MEGTAFVPKWTMESEARGSGAGREQGGVPVGLGGARVQVGHQMKRNLFRKLLPPARAQDGAHRQPEHALLWCHRSPHRTLGKSFPFR